MDIKVGKAAIRDAHEKLRNWGRWGTDDQIGTLNHITARDIIAAAALIRKGKVFALGIPLDRSGRWPKNGRRQDAIANCGARMSHGSGNNS